ncbi:hypothetical protein MPER_01381 [Moniliophthora perniciosa FA553]|nr:hypothetical protein MPER_01381 [Moniliophthora perniciosa FA553]
MFETLERESQANILNALTRVHQHGIVLGDFREPNVLVDEKNQVRFIDFEEIADEHECPSTYEFSVTKTTLSSKEEGTLCPFLSVIGSQMGFWIEEEVTIGKYKFPAELFPPQDVINALLPERLLNSYTTPCVESLLGVYYGIVQERMDKGAELDELEPEQEQMMREAEERWKIRFPWLQSPRLRPHRKPSTNIPSP